MEEFRPDPDALLAAVNKEGSSSGRLRIFFGYAAGVGKTYAMLEEAHLQSKAGKDVLVGYIEPHTRPETMQLLDGLVLLPPAVIPYKNITLKEFDLDAALKKRPEIVLVDELAHTNAAGCRNKKRYQDVEELLLAGIDVYTAVNVQHIESLNDVIMDITGINVRETVPDFIFERSDIKLIDISPEELLKRFESGKVYAPERAETAMKKFFSKENLRSLREISMRKSADRVSQDGFESSKSPAKSAAMKFLVCISSAPSSARCIRWSARIAEAMHAPLTVLYVETHNNVYLSDADKKTLQGHIELAQRLGAEIVTLYGDDVPLTVSEYARTAGITNIVIGKKIWTPANILKPGFEDRLIRMLEGVEIHIVSQGARDRRGAKKSAVMKYPFYISWPDLGKMSAILAATTVFCEILTALGIGEQNIIMLYILSVLIISRITSGYLHGILASLLSVLCFNFFFTDPIYTFDAIRAGYPVTFAIMLIIALITSTLTMRINAQAELAVSRERRTEVLYGINKKLLITPDLKGIVDLANEYVVNIFGRSVVFYTQDPLSAEPAVLKQSAAEPDSSFLMLPDEKAVAHWTFVNQKPAGAGTDTLMGADAFYMPLMSHGKVLGVMGLSCPGSKSLTTYDRNFFEILGSLIAIALEREYLSQQQHCVAFDAEKEKMRANLLRAISHDLRTPLTSIAGASSLLLENGCDAGDDSTRELLGGIRDDSQWLIRMVENLLSVTRIKGDNLSVDKMPEAAEEIIAEAISRTKRHFPARIILAKSPEELLMVPMDATLIIQVIMNLLENAIKNSSASAKVDVVVRRSGSSAVFEVFDEGEGVPADDLPHLFEGKMSVEDRVGDRSRGMGIGLSICMSIIKAHGGEMHAANRPEGGAIFRFTLPL